MKLLAEILRFMYFSESNLYLVDLPDSREGQVENLGKKEKYRIFPGLLKGIRPKSPYMCWETLNYIFLV